MLADGLAPSEELASKIARYHEQWPSVGVRRVWSDDETPVSVRTPVTLRAEVGLGRLDPSEVRVQAVHGVLNDSGDLVDADAIDMRLAGADEGTRLPEGVRVFEGVITPSGSGQCGVSVRVVPRDDRLVGTRLPGLIAWDFGETEPLGDRDGVTKRAPKPRASSAEPAPTG